MNAKLRAALVPGCLVLFSCSIAATQQPAPAQDAPYQLQVEVNRVLVPVVVRDKQGRVVTDLKQEDFQVFDNDKPRPFSGFTVQQRGASSTALSKPANPSKTPASAAPSPAVQALTSGHRYLLFLFDDMHLTFEDMARAKKAAASTLAAALAVGDMSAVVSTSGKTNSGLTNDPAKLQAAIAALQPRALMKSDVTDCPKLDYYQADLMQNKNDANAKAEAVQQVFRCSPGLDPKTDTPMAERLADSAATRVVNLGRQDALATYLTFGQFVKAMASLPGERSLVLVSPGFLPLEQDALTQESRLIDQAAQANVTISALDARGLYTTNITAGEQVIGDPQYQGEIRRQSMSRAETAMGELADGTGGNFFHNSNDLDSGLKSVAMPPECIYLLELPLDNIKQNGSYHRLKVKVNRDGLEVQARRGYYVAKPEKNKK